MTKETEIESALVWANEDHALAKTNASLFWHLSSNAEVGSFATVEEVAPARSDPSDSLRIGFFRNMASLVSTENSCDDILCADDERPGVGELRGRVRAVENSFAYIVETRPSPTIRRLAIRCRDMKCLCFGTCATRHNPAPSNCL